MRKFSLIFCMVLCVSSIGLAQTTFNDSISSDIKSIKTDLSALKRLKISGYIQAQFQYADSSGQPAIGSSFAPGNDKQFSIRRGRVKFQYSSAANKKGITTSQYVLQFDVTERGVTIKDAYVRAFDPWTGWVSLTAGMFNRPFGHEIGFSSSQRESPERARINTLLFPGERDLGASIAIQAPKSSPYNPFRIEAGLFNGNGAPGAGGDVSDFDKKKDFIGRLSYEKSFNEDRFTFGAGVSYYNGGYRIDSVNVYKSGSDVAGVNGFIINSTAFDNGNISLVKRNYTERQYAGADLQFGLNWIGGRTIFRGEFIAGDQPGFSSDTKSPNDKKPISKDIYNRKFNGALFYLVHAIAQSDLSIVLKYDWYDPNTDAEKNDIGKAVSSPLVATNSTDLRYDTFGFGALYALDANMRFTAYYDIVTNEISTNLSGYTKDRKDNLFTLRLQVRF